MLWPIIILFAILSAVLLSGKGGFLIAGYNTSSAREKAKYDEKKLCRVTGTGTALITVLLLLSALERFGHSRMFPIILGVGIPVIIIGMLIAMNTICKNKSPVSVPPKPRDLKKEKRSKALILGFIAVTFLLVGITMFTGSLTITLDNSGIYLHTSGWEDKEILYSDIQSIEYTDQLTPGRRVFGLGNYVLRAGDFKNDRFGKYVLYSYNRCKEYIIVETPEGTVVFNGKDSEKTKEVYQEILNRIPGIVPAADT